MKADIAIITIRDDEFGAVFGRLKEYLLAPLNGPSSERTYAIFSVPIKANKACAVALARCSEQGNDVSQQVASDMIRDMDPQLLLVVGIAGGVPNNEFTLGDVIISSRIHNFNVSAFNQGDITFDSKGGIHPFVSNITASLPMYENLLASWNERDSIGGTRPSVDLFWAQSNVYGDTKWRKDVLKSLNSHFGESVSQARLPLFKTGSIASSNSLMKDTKIPTRWLESARGILAVEMESAGVLQAAQQINKQYPVMAIRGMSDIIGLKRDERWTAYACQSVGAFTCAFVKAGIVEPQDSSTITPHVHSQPLHPPVQRKAGNFTSATGTQESKKPVPLDVFISYSADDEKLKHELETHLVMLKRKGTIRPWHSQQMGAGVEWEKEISDLIDQSQIILLLISPSFLASDYLYDQEMQHAMERHESGDARVVPIIIRSATIGETPFHKLQTLPRNLQPVDTWRNRDEIWTKIAQEIQDVCNNLLNSQKQL
jgi:nucleoside phosphorylase